MGRSPEGVEVNVILHVRGHALSELEVFSPARNDFLRLA